MPYKIVAVATHPMGAIIDLGQHKPNEYTVISLYDKNNNGRLDIGDRIAMRIFRKKVYKEVYKGEVATNTVTHITNHRARDVTKHDARRFGNLSKWFSMAYTTRSDSKKSGAFKEFGTQGMCVVSKQSFLTKWLVKEPGEVEKLYVKQLPFHPKLTVSTVKGSRSKMYTHFWLKYFIRTADPRRCHYAVQGGLALNSAGRIWRGQIRLGSPSYSYERSLLKTFGLSDNIKVADVALLSVKPFVRITHFDVTK